MSKLATNAATARRSTFPTAAVIRAARTLERYEVRELLRVAPNRDASLMGPARLLDALRAWRAVFDPPKVRIQRFAIVTLTQRGKPRIKRVRARAWDQVKKRLNLI